MDFLSSGMQCIYFPVSVQCFHESLASTAFGDTISLVRANYFCIWNAFLLLAAGFCNWWKHCEKWNIWEGRGNLFLQQDQRNDWCVVFSLSQPWTIVMHICCHLLGPDTVFNQQIPGQSFGRNIDKMESWSGLSSPVFLH